MSISSPPSPPAGFTEPPVFEDVITALDELQSAWTGAVPAFATNGDAAAPSEVLSSSGRAAVELDTMTDAGLIRVVDRLGELQHTLDGLQAAAAGTVAARSGKERGGEGLAKRLGHASAAVVVSERWRVSLARAAVLVDVGSAIVPKRSFLGVVQECEFPRVAVAIRPGSHLHPPVEPLSDPAGDSGRVVGDGIGCGMGAPVALTVDAAAAIVRELRLGAKVSEPGKVASIEETLVDHCTGVGVSTARRAAVVGRTILDEDGTEPREHVLKSRRSLTIIEQPDGMTKLTAVLDPESAMWVRGALDAIVGTNLRTPAFVEEPDQARANAQEPDTTDSGTAPDAPATDMPDPRTIEQLRLDALIDVCRHTAGCAEASTALAPVSIVVRMNLTELQAGLGHATIDGVTEPVSAGAVRRLAGDANLIPAVLNGPSQILDLGRSRRLFSPAQRLALTERDGGCAWTGCPHPPAYTEAHHIEWWSAGGRTDLGNGVMLCTHHHHRIHADGWGIRVRDGSPWFIPPAHLDRSRTPKRGGRVRLERPG
ncbi:DUF222 domain-containing protein [Plantibacter sp. Mn2098]|uniref:HNH endonuclease n=1 Tax=Plantibacter sp. Mn2098 TaxID=3395266 RepID=UPI003BBF8BC6